MVKLLSCVSVVLVVVIFELENRSYEMAAVNVESPPFREVTPEAMYYEDMTCLSY